MLTADEVERIRKKLQRDQERADKEAIRIKNVTVLKKKLKGAKKGAYLRSLQAPKLLAKI